MVSGKFQENEMEGCCLGMPIAGPDVHVLAALSISGPVYRMGRAESLVPELRRTCATIAHAVGR